MPTNYVAHGLKLRCAFPLPGMRPAADDDQPSLTLELTSPALLAKLWSETRAAPAWRGRMGDGCELTIEHGDAGDVLFRYGDRAQFHLDATRRSLTCAPGEAGLRWQRALLTKVLVDVGLLRGSEALHASAVDSAQGAIAIVAPSGTGKTTLALELMSRGHALLTDDVLTLSEGRAGVLAHPATPHMNLAAEHHAAATSLVTTLGRIGRDRWVAARKWARTARPIRAIFLLQRRNGLALTVERLPPAPLALAPYMLGLDDDLQRERKRFALFADLAASAALLRLSGGPGDRPIDIADLIERALAQQRPALATGPLA